MQTSSSTGGKSGSRPLSLAKARSNWQQTVARFGRNVSGLVGLVMILTVTILSLGAPFFTQASPTDMDMAKILKPPNAEHIFGTDEFGRDLFSRVLYGGRISLLVGIVVASATMLFGILIGAVAGFYPRLDNPLMRAMDILMAFPTILLALGIVAILGPKLINVIIALIIPFSPGSARVVRSIILSLKEKEFTEAARSIGVRDRNILLRHLLPNCVGPVLVQQTYIMAIAILSEAGLNFLGVGVRPEIPTLGGIISAGRNFLRYAPWMSLFPGIMISVLVLGANLLGDGLRDVLDPHMK